MVQKTSNLSTELGLADRLATKMAQDMSRLMLSDGQLVDRIKLIPPLGRGSLSTVRRCLNGKGDHKITSATLGLIAQALDWSETTRNWVQFGDSPPGPGTPTRQQHEDQLNELYAYLQRLSNLPYEVQKKQASAKTAISEGNYQGAGQLLGEISTLLKSPAIYAAEEYARALAAQGALAFTEFDYGAARFHYGKAIDIYPMPEQRVARYRNSYLIACCASAAAAKSEVAARAILKEMRDHNPPVEPNVVTYNTLMIYADGTRQAMAVLRLMRRKNVTPDEISVTTAIGSAPDFPEALRIVDFALLQGWFVGRGAFQAAFAHPVHHLDVDELLTAYHGRKYKYDTALGSPIRQYIRENKLAEALLLTLVAPNIGAAQKIYRTKYSECLLFFQGQINIGNDDDNLYYAWGIASALNRDWANAIPMLGEARLRATHEKRIAHIDELLAPHLMGLTSQGDMQ